MEKRDLTIQQEMNHMKKVFSVFLVFCLLFPRSCIKAQATWQNDTEQSTTAKASEEAQYYPNVVDLYFPSDPSTGFSWFAQTDNEDILGIEEEFFPVSNEPDLMGSGGTHWFRFRGLQEGITSVRLTYTRPWEPIEESCTQYSFIIRISVDARKNVLIWGIEMGEPEA